MKTIVTCTLLGAANICSAFRAPTRVVASPSPLCAEATETNAPAEAEAAAPAPAAAAAFDPNNVFEIDESPLMAYIARSWNKLDGSSPCGQNMPSSRRSTGRSAHRLGHGRRRGHAQGRRHPGHDQQAREDRGQRPHDRRVPERAPSPRSSRPCWRRART